MAERRKIYRNSPEWLRLVEEGKKREGEAETWVPIKELRLVRTPFDVVGLVHVNGEGWKFRCVGADARGVLRTWLVPREVKADELLASLASQGAQTNVERDVGQALLEFMASRLDDPHVRVREIVERMGWHTPPGFEPGEPIERAVFVFPNGESLFQQGDMLPLPELLTDGPPPFRRSEKGTVCGWVTTVSPFIRGQRKGLLALSMAVFASVGRLIPGASGLEIILTGSSSNGKTTWLLVAESFSGKPGESQLSFNSTANALEANVRQRRDMMSAADEMTPAKPEVVDALGYIANGAGRIRADIRGDARTVENFFPVLFGTSEASASAKLAEMGKATTGGQEARLLCPDCDSGQGFRAFTTLDECDAPELEGWRALSVEERLEENNRTKWGAKFSKALDSATRKAYGAPGRAWRQWAADNLEDLLERVPEKTKAFNEVLDILAAQRFTGKSLSAVGRRVADRFAQLSACLDIANEALRLELGESTDIRAVFVEECLAYAEKQQFFEGSVERIRYLEKLEAELSRFGDSRFQEIWEDVASGEERFSQEPHAEKWGYLDKRDKEEPLFLVSPAVFRSALCFGMDERMALEALEKAGFLKHEGERFISGALRYTLRKTIKGARVRFVAMYASPAGGLKKKDEEVTTPRLKLVHALKDDGSTLREIAIDDNGF